MVLGQGWSEFLSSWILLAAASGSVAFPQDDEPVSEKARPASLEFRRAERERSFEGCVLDVRGRPAGGVTVFASAGGRTSTDADGRFLLVVNVPEETEAVQLLALSAGNLARIDVPLLNAARSVPVGTLRLASGGGCAPEWLPTFGGTPGPSDGSVSAVLVHDDGSGPALYVGGSFTLVAGKPAAGVARWDGASWSAVGEGPGITAVNALCVYDDGGGARLYAGGYSQGGTTARRIASWDGTTWSVPSGLLYFGTVSELQVHDDGNGPALYAGGDFAFASPAIAVNGIARWDGQSWSALGGGIGEPGSGRVYGMASFDDGGGPALFVTGSFTTAGGVAAKGIACWRNGAWSSFGDGLSGFSSSWGAVLRVLDDGTGPALYLGGHFGSVDGIDAHSIARWNGQSWSAVGTPPTSSLTVLSLASYGTGGGAVLVAGASQSQSTAPHLLVWDGSGWTVVETTAKSVRSITAGDLGSGVHLFVGGSVSTVEGVGVTGVAGFDGTAWYGLGGGLVAPARALAVHDDGAGPALFVGGEFESVHGLSCHRIARWDGVSWSALGAGLGGTVYSLCSFDDGQGPRLVAGGQFSLAGGVPAANLAVWDGVAWAELGGGVGGTVRALAVHDDGAGPALFVAGAFGSAGGDPLKRFVARWDGSAWTRLGGVNSTVRALAVYDAGGGPELFVGGDFKLVNGVTSCSVARWDGSTMNRLEDGPITTYEGVRALAVYDHGAGPVLYVGGGFQAGGGLTFHQMARWDGSTWSTVGSGTNELVEALQVFDDGQGPRLFVAGAFTTAGGIPSERIASWDGTSWAPVSGMSDRVSALTVLETAEGPALIAGGEFGAAYESADSFLALRACVPDTQAPEIESPAVVRAIDVPGSPPGELVTFEVQAVDDHDPAPVLQVVPPSGSLFPRGTTLVTCTATDFSGNQSVRQFPVIVELKIRVGPTPR